MEFNSGFNGLNIKIRFIPLCTLLCSVIIIILIAYRILTRSMYCPSFIPSYITVKTSLSVSLFQKFLGKKTFHLTVPGLVFKLYDSQIYFALTRGVNHENIKRY